jgi:hypothetical protein
VTVTGLEIFKIPKKPDRTDHDRLQAVFCGYMTGFDRQRHLLLQVCNLVYSGSWCGRWRNSRNLVGHLECRDSRDAHRHIGASG